MNVVRPAVLVPNKSGQIYPTKRGVIFTNNFFKILSDLSCIYFLKPIKYPVSKSIRKYVNICNYKNMYIQMYTLLLKWPILLSESGLGESDGSGESSSSESSSSSSGEMGEWWSSREEGEEKWGLFLRWLWLWWGNKWPNGTFFFIIVFLLVFVFMNPNLSLLKTKYFHFAIPAPKLQLELL